MDVLKGYFQPAFKKRPKKVASGGKTSPTPSVELSVTPPQGSAISTPLRTPFVSRPSSIYPEGDFRNGPREIVLDIKADVMATWINQQQMERMWSTNLPGEGIVLKKARDNFTCAPMTLRNEVDGFFDQVVAMNVRVSYTRSQYTQH